MVFLGAYKESAHEPFAVFKQAELDVQSGDRLRLTDNHQAWGLYKNAQIKVEKVNTEHLQLSFGNGEKRTVSTRETSNLFLDYDYVFTVYSAQGKTSKSVISDFPSYNENSDHTHFLVAISRAVESALIFTDSSKKLQNKIDNGVKQRRIALSYMHDVKHLQTPALELSQAKMSSKNPGKSSAVSSDSTSKYHKQSTDFPQYDIKQLQSKLNNSLHEWLPNLVNVPIKKSGNSLKVGRGKGSLTITTQGTNAGLWFDFSTRKGGNLIQLFCEYRGCSFSEALAIAGNLTGIYPNNFPVNHVQSSPTITHEKENEIDKKAEDLMKKSEQFVKESSHISGTLAEKYLRQYRGISGELPNNLRFHPGVTFNEKFTGKPALIAPVFNKNGELKRAQYVYLDPKTGSKTKSNFDKQTIGKDCGDACILAHNPSSKTAIFAEGIETGLSLLEAHPDHMIVVGFGQNFDNITLPNHITNVVLAADNDGDGTYKRQGYQALISKMHTENIAMRVAIPEKSGHDFNDILRNNGVDSVRHAVSNSITAEAFNHISSIKNDAVMAESTVKNNEHNHIDSTPNAHDMALKQAVKMPQPVHSIDIEM